jgi:hypothetical protein
VRISRFFRVVIADDDPVTRSCLRTQLIDLGCVLVGEARELKWRYTASRGSSTCSVEGRSQIAVPMAARYSNGQ